MDRIERIADLSEVIRFTMNPIDSISTIALRAWNSARNQGTVCNSATGDEDPSGTPLPFPGCAGEEGGAGFRTSGPVPPGEPLPVGD